MSKFDEFKELEPQEDIKITRDNRWVNYGLDVFKESDDELFMESRDPRTYPNHPRDVVHLIQSGELNARFDVLSAAHYQTVLLWHVFMDVNNVMDPFEDTLKGKAIRVPSRQIVSRAGRQRV